MTESEESLGEDRQIFTFLIADIRGYTRFTNQHGVAAAAQLADRFAVICRAVADRQRGEVTEPRGDEALTLFSSSRDAVLAAAELQRAFPKETAAHRDRPMRVGIGIDSGEAIPVQATSFNGRQREVREVQNLLLRDEVRLLTLAGPGGSGKTRLALRVGEEIRDSFERGVFLVNLSGLSDPELVAAAIVATLNVREEPGSFPIDSLKLHVGDKEMLLMLDTFEHLLDGAPMIGVLLGACPNLTILVTSRSALRLAWEHTYTVSPLAVPDMHRGPDLETLVRFDAVALFLDRARAVEPVPSGIDTLALAMSLLEKSLLSRRVTADGDTRILMLDTIREFAALTLRASDEDEQVRATHARYYLDFAAAKMPGEVPQEVWFSLLGDEWDILRAAIEWARAHKDMDSVLRGGAALHLFWISHGFSSEARAWLDDVEVWSDVLPVMERVDLLAAAARVAGGLSDPRTNALLEERARLRGQLGDPGAAADDLNLSARRALAEGDIATGRRRLEQELVIRRQLDEGVPDVVGAPVRDAIGGYCVSAHRTKQRTRIALESRSEAGALAAGQQGARAMSLQEAVSYALRETESLG